MANKYLLDLPNDVANDMEKAINLLNERNSPLRCSKKDFITEAIKQYVAGTIETIKHNEGELLKRA